MKNRVRKKTLIRIFLLIAAAVLLFAGISDGGYRDVKNKAVRICYECMGIG
ncbi:MAG: hypothetical protein K5686_08565 [Lachnospiraceae bacterium]|nr:hypothetical protein [Lachnospiraceae bacterium]